MVLVVEEERRKNFHITIMLCVAVLSLSEKDSSYEDPLICNTARDLYRYEQSMVRCTLEGTNPTFRGMKYI
jgi:hypothetical protein